MIVVLPFKDRMNYLRITLSTIREAMRNRDDIFLHLFDDMSEDTYPAIVDEMNHAHPVAALIMKQHKLSGAYQATANAIDMMFDMYQVPYIFTLDSDCIVHPDVFSVAETMVNELPDLGFGTLFNTDTHKIKHLISEKYVEKESIGGLGCIIKRNAWEWYKKNTKEKGPKHKGWDWDFCMWLKESKQWKIYSTYNSYINHIGQTGSHSGPACKIDRAVRFLD